MPGARRPASGLAFQGICQAPTLTSWTSVPSGSGLLQGQQKPAVRRAEWPSSAFERIRASSCSTESTMRKSNVSLVGSQVGLAASVSPSCGRPR